jgi:hypothetical protein
MTWLHKETTWYLLQTAFSIKQKHRPIRDRRSRGIKLCDLLDSAAAPVAYLLKHLQQFFVKEKTKQMR